MIDAVISSELPPARAWDQVFRGAKYSSQLVAEIVIQLQRRKAYEQAVECLLSSLRNDHAQPWTYDVLAVFMNLAGRPAAELERVVQSRVDFTGGDVSQMLVTAALLSRFDAHAEALRVCLQATETAPEQPEPWLLAKSQADKAGDTKQRIRVRCGILRHVWTADHAVLHKEAVQTIRTLIEELEKAGDPSAASDARERLAAAQAIDLHIIVRWTGTADLDLLVEEPGKSVCSVSHRLTTNGGRLIHDDGGTSTSESGSRYEEYICHTAPSGDYSAVIRFILGKAVAGSAVVEIVRNENTPGEQRTRSTVSLGRTDVKIRVPLTSGRR